MKRILTFATLTLIALTMTAPAKAWRGAPYKLHSATLIGDVNGNGGVDIGDAVSIVNYLVGKPSTTFIEQAADTNKNGKIDIGDAVTIVNFLVGKTTSLARSIDVEREPQ